MAKARSAKIKFPLGGSYRRAGYAQKTQPFTAPRAVNVRAFGPLERRGRGGSRPGLVKLVDNDFGTNILGIQSITYLDSDGDRQQDLAVICDGVLNIVSGETVTPTTANLVTDDGDMIVDEDGNQIIFTSTVSSSSPLDKSSAFSMVERGGKLYIADSSLKKYDPVTGVVEVVAGAPTSQPLVCVYQERLVLAGEDHMFYMCAQADETDWNFTVDKDNVGRAVAGYVGDGGKLGEVINSMVNYQDKALILGTTDSLWAVYGNPAGGGKKVCVSAFSGVVAPSAITVTPDGLVLFVTRRGIYSWRVGSEQEPEPFSLERLPEALLDTDPTAVDVQLIYDHKARGVHLFMTPSTGDGTHWWLDLVNKAFWEVSFGTTTHQPVCTGRLATSGDSGIMLGCQDGYLRYFANSAEDDDGEDLESNLLLGPFHVPRMEGADGMVAEMVAAFAAGSGDVTWKLVMANSAETVVDLAEDMLAGTESSDALASGTWLAGQNKVVYPRSRGAWAVLWLSATEPWAYEAVTMWMKKLGRLR